MSIRTFLVILVAFLIAMATGCSDKEEPGLAPEDADLTVEDVYARFAEAINQPGSIYHTTVDTRYDTGASSTESIRQLWVDVERDLVRQEIESVSAEGDRTRSSIVVTNRVSYAHLSYGSSRNWKTEAQTCHGAGAAVSAMLGCPGENEESATEVEVGEWEERPAIILVTAGTTQGSLGAFTFTERLYLDETTFLPIAREGERTYENSEGQPAQWLHVFENEFVAASSLPDDFFDPASIGYVERDPEEPLLVLDISMTVYWLGRSFEGEGSLPPLALAEVSIADPEAGYGDTLTLKYRLADDELGPTVLTLEEWGLAVWDAMYGDSATADWRNQPCWEYEEITLPAGQGTIIMGFEDESETTATPGGEVACPDVPHDRFGAHAQLGSTVIVIDAPSADVYGSGLEDSPYNTPEGMNVVLRALLPRE